MSTDFLPLNGSDLMELYVGNAEQAALYYKYCFGFEFVAYAVAETGVRDLSSYVVQQNKIRFVLTTSLESDSAISEHVKKHGDGVKVLALWVDDAVKSFHETTLRGAVPAMEPTTLTDESGKVIVSSIKTYGETLHTFVERKNYKGAFLPGYRAIKNTMPVKPIGLLHVDHCVGNVELAQMDKWVTFY